MLEVLVSVCPYLVFQKCWTPPLGFLKHPLHCLMYFRPVSHVMCCNRDLSVNNIHSMKASCFKYSPFPSNSLLSWPTRHFPFFFKFTEALFIVYVGSDHHFIRDYNTPARCAAWLGEVLFADIWKILQTFFRFCFFFRSFCLVFFSSRCRHDPENP